MRVLLIGLSLAALAAPAAAQWVRPEGSQRSTIRRGEPPPQRPVPGMLPNLHNVCRLWGWENGAALRGGDWYCVGADLPMNLDDVCRLDDRDRRGLVAFQATPGDPLSWQCATPQRAGRATPGADMGERTASAESGAPVDGYDAGVAPTAPTGDAPPAGLPIPGGAPATGPAAAPGPVDASATAEAAPQGLVDRVLAPWTSLPFYARAVIAGLGALVMGLMLGTMLRRKPGREDRS